MAPRRRRRRLPRGAAWLEQHARTAIDTLGRMRRNWPPALMTAAVIGIALGLPAVFVVFMDNVEAVIGDWEGGTRISAFLHKDTPEARMREAAAELGARADVAAVQVLTPEAALAEFRAHTAMARAVEVLDDNPLPGVLLVSPARGLAPAAVRKLSEDLKALDASAEVRVDREWVQRLHALLTLGKRTAWMIAALLALAVLLVVGNTIRLEIENRREEIVITKLLGATDAFVRRPFLYSGLWHGLFGGLIAAGLVQAAYLLLTGPANALARSYASDFRLQGLDAAGMLTLSGCGVLLGLLGSWLAVGRHLRRIEPR